MLYLSSARFSRLTNVAGDCECARRAKTQTSTVDKCRVTTVQGAPRAKKAMRHACARSDSASTSSMPATLFHPVLCRFHHALRCIVCPSACASIACAHRAIIGLCNQRLQVATYNAMLLDSTFKLQHDRQDLHKLSVTVRFSAAARTSGLDHSSAFHRWSRIMSATGRYSQSQPRWPSRSMSRCHRARR